MGLRVKRTVLEIAAQHFKEFNLPLTIEHKDYVAAVGTKMAVNAISVKRSFKKWSVLLHALRKHYPELAEAPKPALAPKPAAAPKAAPAKPAPAPKAAAAPVKKES
jgi:hypothetical protein